MIPFRHGETVTRLRATLIEDPYSSEDTEPDWEFPAELDIPGCAFNPGVSSEPLQNARNAVITRPEVYAPPGADVLAGDRLVVRGVTYEVQGNPQDWISPFTGWHPGLVVPLEAVEG
jgi:hypothetical protein